MRNRPALLRLAIAVLALILTAVLAWRADAAQPMQRDCVPLHITVGAATRTEWFGIGGACR